MSIESNIKKMPRAFDPELGRTARAAVSDISPLLGDLIAGVGGSSPYLHSLILAFADWLPFALAAPEEALVVEQQLLLNSTPGSLSAELRRSKSRHALLIALADLSGAWTLDQVTFHLTEFADLACGVALNMSLAPLINHGKLPEQSDDNLSSAAGICVLAMGKMGAHELNFSSDIDLIFLFDDTRYDRNSLPQIRAAMVKVVRSMCSILSDRKPNGYVFRTDLRLRPDPSVTPIVMSMDAAERYYESFGRTWERAAFIKARPCAGDIAAGKCFLKTLIPFVWRKHLDFAAIEDAHDMRLRIRDHKRLSNVIDVAGHDVKLGLGGIREIEFFAQTRQLISGGRDRDLRCRKTTDGLAALAQKGWISNDAATLLIDHYCAHREVEHRLQMLHDAQTHVFPRGEEGAERIACLMGCDSFELKTALNLRLREVHQLTEKFFVSDYGNEKIEYDSGVFDISTEVLERWLTFPAFRTERSRTLFERLRPELISRIVKTTNPAQTLVVFEKFLAGLPSGVQIFSLFQANHLLLDLLIDIAGTSPSLADYLSRNSLVFDAVIGGDFFLDWPTVDQLRADLVKILLQEESYEQKLDAARVWFKERHFRIGVHHLRGLVDNLRVGEQYADLATAVISELWSVVVEEFSIKHGQPPGRGAAILGMGSLGSQRMTATSDLDLILIYDAEYNDISCGKRPLTAQTYFAKLTRTIITALSAPTSHGKLYSVDLRLRPSGNKGPVAISLESFVNYQRNEAWVWEHLALTQARVVAGSSDIAAQIENFRRELFLLPFNGQSVIEAVKEMRVRLKDAKKPIGVWDTKNGPGRLQDIDLIIQANALILGLGSDSPVSILEGKFSSNLLTQDEVDFIAECYWLFLKVLFAVRLLSTDPISDEELEGGGALFLCCVTGAKDIASLKVDLQSRYKRTATIIDSMISRYLNVQ
ncbi:MAG: glutamine-synthetase adenylyltransferase [Aestuariivita sp.]|nr:glutamine-synthetase adenylyltransferase [Aestuariivita sp.]